MRLYGANLSCLRPWLIRQVGLHSISDESHLEHSHSLEQARSQTPAEEVCIASDSEAEPGLRLGEPTESVQPNAALVLRYSLGHRQQQSSDQTDTPDTASARPPAPCAQARTAQRSPPLAPRYDDSSLGLQPGAVFQNLEELREAAEDLKEAHECYDAGHLFSKQVLQKRSTSTCPLRLELKANMQGCC